jgi:hypothetical protein
MPRLSPKRTLLLTIPLIAALAAYLTLRPRPTQDLLHAPARIQWKDHAISLIQQRYNDHPWIAAQTAHLQARTATRPFANWIADEFLLMKNGDWIIYQSLSEKNPPHLPDLFIGLGSNGRWYYSSFRFGPDNANLRGEGTQPDSLLQFADGYSLRPFTPPSNDCLQSTWSPGLPYGVDYFKTAHTTSRQPTTTTNN